MKKICGLFVVVGMLPTFIEASALRSAGTRTATALRQPRSYVPRVGMSTTAGNTVAREAADQANQAARRMEILKEQLNVVREQNTLRSRTEQLFSEMSRNREKLLRTEKETNSLLLKLAVALIGAQLISGVATEAVEHFDEKEAKEKLEEAKIAEELAAGAQLVLAEIDAEKAAQEAVLAAEIAQITEYEAATALMNEMLRILEPITTNASVVEDRLPVLPVETRQEAPRSWLRNKVGW